MGGGAGPGLGLAMAGVGWALRLGLGRSHGPLALACGMVQGRAGRAGAMAAGRSLAGSALPDKCSATRRLAVMALTARWLIDVCLAGSVL